MAMCGWNGRDVAVRMRGGGFITGCCGGEASVGELIAGVGCASTDGATTRRAGVIEDDPERVDAGSKRWSRLQATTSELLDRSEDYLEALVRVVDIEWTTAQRLEADRVLRERESSSIFFTILMDDYSVRRHFALTDSHRQFVMRSFRRLAPWLHSMTADQAERHDLSKYGLRQAVGYTQRWVHGHAGTAWIQALGHHYFCEPHHPQFHTMATEGPGRMARHQLEESVVDMMACRWERHLDGADDVPLHRLMDFRPEFLERYLPEDLKEVKQLLSTICSESSAILS